MFISMLKNGQTSIRKISVVTGCSYGNLLKASKTPIVGQTYDPEAINEEALIKVVRNKLGEDFENFDWSQLEVSEVEKTETELNLELGSTLKFKRGHGKCDPESVYTVVFFTETHVVLNSSTSTEPRVIAKTTLKLFGAFNLVDEEFEQVETENKKSRK